MTTLEQLPELHPSQYADPDECGGWGLTRETADRANEAFAAWLDAGKPDKRDSSEGRQMKAARAAHREERARFRAETVATGERSNFVDIVSHFDPDTGPITDTDEGAAYWDDVQAAVAAGVPNGLGAQR